MTAATAYHRDNNLTLPERGSDTKRLIKNVRSNSTHRLYHRTNWHITVSAKGIHTHGTCFCSGEIEESDRNRCAATYRAAHRRKNLTSLAECSSKTHVCTHRNQRSQGSESDPCGGTVISSSPDLVRHESRVESNVCLKPKTHPPALAPRPRRVSPMRFLLSQKSLVLIPPYTGKRQAHVYVKRPKRSDACVFLPASSTTHTCPYSHS